MIPGIFWRGLNGALLFAFIMLLIVLPRAYALIPLMAAIGMALGLVLSNVITAAKARLDRDDAWFCAAFLVYGGLWLLDVWRTGNWPIGERYQQGALLPFMPLLAAALLVWLRCYPPSPRVLWYAVCSGALGAGAIALHERAVLGLSRASNGMNAIPFGNLSLLLGGLSLLAALWCMRRGTTRSWWLMTLALLAAAFGVMGSLLSGTRGGWIALPFMLLLTYRGARDLVPARRLKLLVAGLMASVLLITLLPQSGVIDRVALVASEAERYWELDRPGNSLGMRMELWRVGGILVQEKPLLGWGEGRLESQRDVLAEEGRVYDRVVIHDQLHNDVIDTAARRGLVGVTILLALYAIPFWLFWTRLRRQSADPGLQVLAVAGLMIPVAFICFGMTQSLLRDVRGLSGYLGLCIACWVSLRAHETSTMQNESDAAKHKGIRSGRKHGLSMAE